MKTKSFKIGVLGMLVFIGSAAFATSSTLKLAAALECTSGDSGVCNTVSEGHACKRLNPEYIGNCGGTQEEEVENVEVAP
ncbi:hypothetical protein OQZ29_09145 [Pedobacter agri]|uniref:DUF3551 domain-containing protein n=2 Tax=Pedobacter agri TaxID=454586 RepID=A0A9X3DCJ0_9SPHI|nr:hypothetical protein [Pedobacter agri]MCX3264909.1 hypothetical protein [Pedobacter agri]